MCVHVHVHVHVHAHERKHVSVSVSVSVSVRMSVRVSECVCVCVCACACECVGGAIYLYVVMWGCISIMDTILQYVLFSIYKMICLFQFPLTMAAQV